MINSMTAFGRSQSRGEWGMAVWEIRSINHRFMEINTRLPEMLRELEQGVRDILSRYFKRGKIECTLRFQPGPKLGSLMTVNQALVSQLTNIASNISATLPKEHVHLNVMELLAWEGVITQENVDINLIKDELLDVFVVAVEDLAEARKREGMGMSQVITDRLDKILVQVEEVKKHLPKVLQRQRDKILTRLNEVKSNLDEQRLEQEMVYFAQKIDVSEEIDRTLSHLSEVKRSLATGESAGRRLDFMMQELNREANTLGSKSVDPLITHAAVEMKVLIEQIREQVQNIE